MYLVKVLEIETVTVHMQCGENKFSSSKKIGTSGGPDWFNVYLRLFEMIAHIESGPNKAYIIHLDLSQLILFH